MKLSTEGTLSVYNVEGSSSINERDELEHGSEAWKRRQLARAFDMHRPFYDWRDLADVFRLECNYDLVIKIYDKACERGGWYERELVDAYCAKALHYESI